MGFRNDLVNAASVGIILARSEDCDPSDVCVKSLRVGEGIAKGDGFMGDMVEVRAKVSVKGGQDRDVHWMIKLYKPRKSGTENFASAINAMEREGRAYAHVLPKMASLLKPGSAVSPPRTCGFVHWDPDKETEMLVLDHMASFGFRDPINKKAGLDLDHCLLVVKWMAAYHALGYALITKHPGGVDAWRKENPWSVPLSQNMPKMWKDLFSGMKDQELGKGLEMARIVQEDPSRDYAGRLKRISESVDGFLYQFRVEAERPRAPFSTLCHLDAWFNNILFRYSEGDKPKPLEALLLDFQFTAYSHPGNDLAFFLVTSATYDLRKKNLDTLLSTYHEHLQAAGSACDLDLSFYTLSDVRNDFNAGLKASLTILVTLLPALLDVSEDTPDFANLDHSNPEAVRAFAEREAERYENVIRSNPDLRSRQRGIFEDLIELGVL